MTSGTLSSIDEMTYDDETGETIATFDPSTEDHSMVVLDVVGDCADRDPTELTSLYAVLDAESLDDMFDGRAPTAALSVSFQYEGYDVTVRHSSVSVVPVF